MYDPRSNKVLRETLHLPRSLRITEGEAYRLLHVLTPAERQRFMTRYEALVAQAEREGRVKKPLRPGATFNYCLSC